jgi:hypothetical protein
MNEIDELKAVRSRIRELETALARATALTRRDLKEYAKH